MLVIKDFATTTLAAALTAGATSIVVSDASRLPTLSAGDYFYLVLQGFTDRSYVEIVKVTGVTSNTLTVVRAQAGSTAKAFVIGDYAELRLTKGTFDEYLAQAITGGVGTAALPFPDVWLPLSDNLNMLAGYGEEIKVGEHVVARKASFSRNSTATYIGKDGTLKTAAVNEPRFEKEGLLIEGQSTNLHAMSETTTSDGNGTGTLTTTTLDGSPALLFQNTNSVYASVPLGCPTLTVGSVYTVSIFTDKSISECAIDVIAGVNAPRITLSSEMKLGNGLYRRWASFTAISSAVKCHYYVATVSGGCKVGRIQVEELPFASSYIPTNGAAATRGKDICWIPIENNGLPEFENEKTISITSDIIGIGSSFNFIVATPWGAIDYTATNERVSGSLIALNMNALVVLKTSVRKAVRFTKGGGCAAIFGSTKKVGPTTTWALDTTRIMIGSMNQSALNPHFGHVRDLKIWLKPLTDEQIKAIA